MRVLLFTGKGGVGKTTVAAATGVRLAEAGQKVLVCSTDPAHSLADALDRRLDGEPREIEPGLSALQLDTRALLAQRWAGVREVLVELTGAAGLSGAGAAGLAADELTVVPGVEELVALAEVRRLAQDDLWDVLVLDCGPTAETLRMLALPEAATGYLQRLWPKHRRVVAAALGRAGGGLGLAAAALQRWEEEAAGVIALLGDPVRTTVRLVLTPERVVLAETRRTVTSLGLHGLRIDAVVANRVLPVPQDRARCGDPAWDWLTVRATEQAGVLDDLRAQLPPDLPLSTLGYRAREPVGVTELGALAAALYGERPVLVDSDVAPSEQASEVRLASGTGLESVYVWQLPLALVATEAVDLARVQDDLLVTVGSQRRRLPLPPVLRRCVAVDAEVHDNHLVVRFAPDPLVWLQ